MKKLAAFFIILVSLVIITACNRSKQTISDVTSAKDSSTNTTITKVEEPLNEDSKVTMEISSDESTNDKVDSQAIKDQLTKNSDLAATGNSLGLMLPTLISLLLYSLLQYRKTA